MLVLIVGPSGAGKDTLLDGARAALADEPRVRFARRVITRLAGVGGEDHEPVDDETFDARLATGRFALHWHAHGLRYAIGAELDRDLAAGRVVVASVSRAVVADAARRYRVRVVEITASPDILAQRLAARAREPADAITARLARAVPLPAVCDVVTIENDGTVAAGVDRLVRELRRCVRDDEADRPGC